MKSILENVLNKEAQALMEAAKRFREEDVQKMISIFELLKNFGGNLIFCGVGKSGHIATKLASTFSSLGLPSYFLHPVEALHGDLGRMGEGDALVFLSKSGTTEEIIKLLPFVKIPKHMIIGLLGRVNSPIADRCGIIFDCSVSEEACIHNQAPTTSSTTALAVGDALAVLYETLTGLSKEHFALNHPGGILGKSLRLTVKDLMIPREHCPCLGESATLKDVILEMTRLPVGLCAIVDGMAFKGIVVEGDIRRTFMDHMDQSDEGTKTPVTKIMNVNPIKVSSDMMAYDALKLMEQRSRQISVLPVVDSGQFMGVVRLHDLLKEGFLYKK